MLSGYNKVCHHTDAFGFFPTSKLEAKPSYSEGAGSLGRLSLLSWTVATSRDSENRYAKNGIYESHFVHGCFRFLDSAAE